VSAVSRLLIDWFQRARRDLPWRESADPYRIWVSEIMLQQTRAQAVIPYYLRFLERFPTVEALAGAPEEQVLTLWAGLGYYSRARNLLKAARSVAARGGFPRDLEGLLALPGIGDYTAAAIASIAFGLPHAVLDGNVLRVVARVENDAADIGSARTRDRFRQIAQQWLDPRRPGDFNQAMMELGATVCLPRNPLCLLCPLRDRCAARSAGTAGELPVKLRKTVPVAVEAAVLIVRRGGRLLLRQRPQTDRRLAGFWELPSPGDLPEAIVGPAFGAVSHAITHHRFTISVHPAKLLKAKALPASFGWFAPAGLTAIPVTTIARKCLSVEKL
jgi:A/G-specific adenine glycosylase